VVEDLLHAGLLVKVEPYLHAVGHCQRCGTMVEPRLSRQWFLSMKPLAEKALNALDSGKGPTFIPDSWTKVYRRWLEEIRDWCISRQLWWGHPIPAYLCSACQRYTVAESQPARCPECGATSLTPDPDVLDTWFSSALWPLSVFGWPDITDDYKRYYPTSVLVTAFDILFFWVARMVMFGLEFTAQVPFEKVYIHGLIRDIQGRKMSKSAGNVVDPMEVIQSYGADTLRFAFAYTISQGQDILLSEDKLEGARRFLNKLWNASRLILMNLPPKFRQEVIPEAEYEWIDRWIWSRLCQVSSEVQRRMELFDFQGATHLLYDFIWGEFCDWYLEAGKVRYYSDNPQRKRVALTVSVYVLRHLLQLLHPFVPFITEKIWSSFPDSLPLLIKTPLQKPSPLSDEDTKQAEAWFYHLLMPSVQAIRGLKEDLGIPVEKNIDVWASDIHKAVEELLPALARVTLHRYDSPFLKKTISAEVFYDTEGIVYRYILPVENLEIIRKRLEETRKEVMALENQIHNLNEKLSNPEVKQKASETVLSEWRKKITQKESQRSVLVERLNRLKSLL